VTTVGAVLSCGRRVLDVLGTESNNNALSLEVDDDKAVSLADPAANQVSVSTRIESVHGAQLPADKRRRRQRQRAVMDSFHPSSGNSSAAADVGYSLDGENLPGVVSLVARQHVSNPVSTWHRWQT